MKTFEMKTFLHVLQALMTLGAIVVGPFTPLYLLSRVPAASSESKAVQAALQEKAAEMPKAEGVVVEKKEVEELPLPPFVQKQHDWFLTENMDSGQWGRELGWGTGCYCQGDAKCIDVKGRVAGHPHFFWYAWSNSDGLVTITLNISLTEAQKEAVAKIQTPSGSWTTGGKTAMADVTHDQFGTEIGTYIETDNTWTERFCVLEGEASKCNERAALEAVLKRLDELPFFDSLILGMQMFSKSQN